MFDRILLALDDPGDHDAALPLVRRLARAVGARMIVMQAVPFLETMAELPHELSPEITGDDEAAQVSVEALVEVLRSDGFPADGFTNVGRGALMIAAAAARVDASLIVLAARARPRFVRTLLRLTPIPVCVVPRVPRIAPPSAGILVPVDGSERSLEVLPFAVALARSFQSGITVVPVGTAESAARDAVDRIQREGIPADALRRRGGILEVCREHSAELIAMRIDGAEPDALHSAPVPVLMVQGPPRAAVDAPSILLPSRTAPVPLALWTRRIASNPLQGVGEP